MFNHLEDQQMEDMEKIQIDYNIIINFKFLLNHLQKILKNYYLNSLGSIGINYKEHDIRFIEDDWESPTLGAAGLGWEVWCDGMEITQFTYFQQMAGIECNPISVEITYGLERICMFIQQKKKCF